MERQNVFEFLERIGALIRNDHFVLTSGRHTSTYLDKYAIYSYPMETAKLALLIAEEFLDARVSVVVGPPYGGYILAHEVALQLHFYTGREVRSAYLEKEKSGQAIIFRRGHDKLIPGKNVLVVEDVITTGGTVKKIVESVRRLGGNIAGVGAICNRGKVSVADAGNVAKVFALVDLPVEAWDRDVCPLCNQGIPINRRLGKG